MELFDSMSESLFGKKPDNVESVKQDTSPLGQIQNNFKFLADMAKDMTSISESVKSLVEMKGGMPAVDANVDTKPEQVIEVEAGEDDEGMKVPSAGKIAKILGAVLAVGGLVTVFWDDIKKAFMDFVSRIYDSIKEQFKEWLSSIGSWFGGIADTVMEKIKVLKDKLVEKVTDMFNAVSQWIGEKIETLVEFFKPVMEFMSDVFESFKEKLKGIVEAGLKVPFVGAALRKMPSLLNFLGLDPQREQAIKEISEEIRKEKSKEIVKELDKKYSGKTNRSLNRGQRLNEELRRRAEEEYLKRLKQSRDNTSQYKETSTYVAQVTPEEKVANKYQDYAQAPTQKTIPERPSTTGKSTVTKVAGDDDIKAMIIGHEGVRNRPYKDSLGLWTVGVGHLIGDGKSLPKEMDRKFSDSEISEMFEIDYAKHKKIAEGTPGYNKANKAGQGAMIDLGFNMGKWWPKWPNTSKALKAGDFNAAARGLEDSKWYTQVGNRAKTIVSLIESAGDQSGGADLSVASAAIGAGQRALSKPKTPNSFDNSQVNNTVIVQNKTSNYSEDMDYSGYAASRV
mgnify:FL=1